MTEQLPRPAYGIHDPKWTPAPLHKLEYLSPSKLKPLMRSEWDFVSKYLLNRYKPKTDSQNRGDLVHKALLQPERFRKDFVIQPKFSGEGMKKRKADWEALLAPGALVMDMEEAMAVNGMISAVYNHPVAAPMLSKGMAERPMFCRDPDLGIDMLGIPDFITEDGGIVDLKTTRDASRQSFERDIFKFGYHIQAAFYRQQFKLITGNALRYYAFVVVEEPMPQNCEVYLLKDAAMDLGWAHLYGAAKKYGERQKEYLDLWVKARQHEKFMAVETDPMVKIEMAQQFEGGLRCKYPGMNNNQMVPADLPTYAYSQVEEALSEMEEEAWK